MCFKDMKNLHALVHLHFLIWFYNLDYKYRRAQLAPVYSFLSFDTKATLNFVYSRLDL